MVARQLGAATHFPGQFFARQTGTGEQCSPLQAFFGSSAEGSRPHPTEQKEKSASKETCPGEINPAPAHKRQSCNNGKAAGRALGGAQRAPPVCKQTRSCGCLPRRGKHCSRPGFVPLNRGPTLTTPQCPAPTARQIVGGAVRIGLRGVGDAAPYIYRFFSCSSSPSRGVT